MGGFEAAPHPMGSGWSLVRTALTPESRKGTGGRDLDGTV